MHNSKFLTSVKKQYFLISIITIVIIGFLRLDTFAQDKYPVWGVNLHNQIYKWNGDNWERQYGDLAQISVGSAKHIWGVDKNGKIYRMKYKSWVLVPGNLKNVAVGNDGDAWGVNINDVVYRWERKRWKKIDGSLKMIAVGNRDNIWGINRKDDIWRWTGNSWEKMPGSLKQISIGSRNNVWGVNKYEDIYYYNGSRWRKMPGSLKDVSVGANNNTNSSQDNYDSKSNYSSSRWAKYSLPSKLNANWELKNTLFRKTPQFYGFTRKNKIRADDNYYNIVQTYKNNNDYKVITELKGIYYVFYIKYVRSHSMYVSNTVEYSNLSKAKEADYNNNLTFYGYDKLWFGSPHHY